MPNDWAWTTLGEITSFAGGYSFPPALQGKASGRWPVFKVSDMNSQGNERTLVAAANWADEAELQEMKARTWPAGTVVFPKVGAALLTEKRRVLGCEGLFDNNVMGLVPTSSVLPPYLLAIMQTVRLGDVAQHGAVPSINQSHVRGIEVYLPPLDEQRRIVDLIDAVDAGLEASAAELDAMADLAEAIRVDAFGNPDGEVSLLGALCHEGGIQIGPFGSQVHAHDYLPEGVPMVMPRDIIGRRISTKNIARISAEHADRLPRHRLRVGDIVLPRRGDLTKRALIGPDEEGWLCGTGCARVRVVDVDPAAVFQALSVPAVDQWLSENAVGATMPNLNTDIISRIPVKLPGTAGLVVDALASIQTAADGLRVLHQALATSRIRLLSDLLSGEHEIPASYDELLEPV